MLLEYCAPMRAFRWQERELKVEGRSRGSFAFACSGAGVAKLLRGTVGEMWVFVVVRIVI